MRKQLAHYRIENLLGESSFAWIYRTFDHKLEQYVALKLLKPIWLADAKAVTRFKREASIARKLHHPDIIDIYDVGEVDGQVYLTQLMIEGESLVRRLTRGPIVWSEVLQIVTNIASALDYAHNEGIIHCDIKPANILLDSDNKSYLGDFGLVRAIMESVSLSANDSMRDTAHYIAPEIWEGKEATPATDIYALSYVICEMIIGEILFEDSWLMAILKKHATGSQLPNVWPRLNIPKEVMSVLEIGLAEDPIKRFKSAGALLNALVALKTQPDTGISQITKSVASQAANNDAEKSAITWDVNNLERYGISRRQFMKLAMGLGILVSKPTYLTSIGVVTGFDISHTLTPITTRPKSIIPQNVSLVTGAPIHWRLVTPWPRTLPVLQEGVVRIANQVYEMSDGELQIEVFGGGEFVSPLETFDAVDAGVVEMGYGAAYYWGRKIPASQFFTSIPFGMNTTQMYDWVCKGGGRFLWEEAYKDFNLLPILAGTMGARMGGWFNKEINTIGDFKGLKIKLPGLGGSVISRAGALVELLPGSKIYTSLERGMIDATEWLAPFHDEIMGFHKVTKYYYYPGWHEPGSILELLVNRQSWKALSSDLQAIVTTAADDSYWWMLNEMENRNSDALKRLVEEESIEVKKFPDQVLTVLKEISTEIIAEIITDDMARIVCNSFMTYKLSQGQGNLTHWSIGYLQAKF
jgi:TRAP-type mannitol/chloroaromatic compound transport system substrate-binding protein